MSANCAPPPDGTPPRQFRRTSAARGRLGTALLRGGRMIKVAGVAASLAHAMGRIAPPLAALPSALAVGAATIAGIDSDMATAGCARSTPYSGDIHCTGQISGTIDFHVSGQELSVTLDSSATVMIPDQESGDGSGDAIHLIHHRRTTVTQGAGGGAISGRRHGINLTKYDGNGDVGISITGSVTGRSGDGVRISQRDTFGNNGRTTVSAGSVTGAVSGIRIFKRGTGIVSINATGAVLAGGSSTLDAGISVSAATARDTLNDVTRSLEGVEITAATVTGANAGILVKNTGPTGWVSVTATGPVTGGTDGIRVVNHGSGGNSLTVSDSVTGGGGGHAAIATRTTGSGAAVVTLLSGAAVGTAGRIAILDGGGSATVAIHSGASVAGAVKLGAGADRLVVAGGSFDGELDGGAGAHEDMLTFLGGSTPIDAASLTNWESVEVASAAEVLVDGRQILAADTLVLSGTLGMADDLAADDVLTVDGDFAGSGTVSINADFGNAMADRLVIAGDLSGVTVIDVSRIGTANGRVEIASVSGTVDSGALRVADGPYLIDFHKASGKFYLRAPNSCTGGDGAFDCTESIIDSQILGASGTDALHVSIGASATFDVDPGHALSLAQDGVAGITLAQAAGGLEISGTLDGIGAVNTGGGLVSISTTGSVTGGERGIFVSNDSSGTGISISAAAPVAGGRGHEGIRAENAGSGDLSISAAAVSGGADGILAIGSGGDMAIAAGTVSSRERSGIVARNHGDGSLTISIASVTAARTGVDAINANGGSLVIAARGRIAITGRRHSHPAIKAENRGSSTDSLMIDVRDVAGIRAGVDARNEGAGALGITVSGSVTTFDSYGSESVTISAYNSANGGDLSIVQRNRDGEPASAIGLSSNRDAIHAINKGSGALSISVEGMIRANSGVIDAANYGSSLSIAVGSAHSGRYDAITVRNLGTGMTSITASGTITGGRGIYARSWGSGLAVSAASVQGSRDAIKAFHFGSGKLTLDVSGPVSSTHGSGVLATSSGTGLEMSMAEISGGTHGILASNFGAGMLEITAAGSVTGQGGDGISAFNGARGADLEILSEGVFGAVTGVRATQSGTGALEIDIAGETVGAAGDGVFASGGAAADGVTVHVRETGSVHGSATGIRAESLNGNLTVSAAGSVSATHGVGVSAAGSGGSLEISTVKTSGGSHGILASNFGAGMLEITAAGSVTGQGGDGISAFNGARGADLEILSEGVFGAVTGVRATQSGTGALEIDIAGETVGAAGDGVFASGGAAADGVTVHVRETGSVHGSATGIRAESLNGNLTVSAAGSVSATHGVGVSAAGSGGSLEISTVKASGGTHGILASNFGAGMLKITATGSVTGQGGDGISAVNGARGADLEIFSKGVFGAATGIRATQSGTGALEIAIAGETVGAAHDGVFASGGAAANGVTVSMRRAGSVRGSSTGIRAESLRGDLSVTARGNVEATSGTGISAAATGGDVTVLVSRIAAATGSSTGVRAVQRGSGRVDVAVFGQTVGHAGDGVAAEIGSGGSGAAVSVGGEGRVAGGASGIRIESADADLTVAADGPVTGRTAYGISAQLAGGDGAIAISATSVTGSIAGISALSNGAGRVSISATGAVVGNVGIVASASSTEGGGLAVSAADVHGVAGGIRASDAGQGSLSVKSTGAVVAASGTGIRASNSARGSSLTISANTIRSAAEGIHAISRGAGALEVTAQGAVAGAAGAGILVRDTAAGAGVSVTAAAVDGGARGIDAYALGNGPLSVTTSGSASGRTASAIFAVHGGRGGVSVTASSATGKLHGIVARAMEEEPVSVSASGHAIGAGGSGIHARSGEREAGANAAVGASGAGGAIRVAAGSATGQQHGIYARRKGTGTLLVSATGSILGRSGSGVRALSLGVRGGDISISIADARGGANGVSALQEAQSPVSITATGPVIGDSGTGILLEEGRGFGASIQAGSVTGARAGIRVPHRGPGAVSITATGSVVGSATHGIYASGGAASAGILVSAATVTGETHGIYAVSIGVGAVSVSATGSVTGGAEDGIYAFSGLNISRASVTASTVTAAKRGISATHYGPGVLTVTASGAVTGLADEGVRARTIRLAWGVAVDVSSTTGGSHGINVIFDGAGTSSVSARGLARGLSGSGIKIADSARGVDIVVAAATAEGATHGIDVSSRGSGAVSVTASGSLFGKTGAGVTIRRHNRSSGGIAVSVADTRGGADGLAVFQHGAGAVSITAAGHAIGDSATGILLHSSGANAAIRAGSATGATAGIQVLQTGDGALSIEATGSVIGSATDGIHALGGPKSTGISVAAATATGGIHGISAISSGSGETAVSASGAATGRIGDGVRVQTGSSGAGVTVAVASATGTSNGISVVADGSGTLSVTASGSASGMDGAGITVHGSTAAADVIVSAASASGTTHGIDAESHGSGTLSVTASGSLFGETGAGVRLRKFGPLSGDVAVSVADARGGLDGVSVFQAGSGTVSVTVTGHAVGDSANGILLRNGSSRGNSWIIAGSATGARNGIHAPNAGRGTLSITATGAVVGGSEDGIHALGGAESTGIAISAATVTGARQGIFASNGGLGTLSVSATGSVTGERNSGISATESISGAGLSITAASVTGRTSGIVASSLGSGTMSVTASGFVRGRTGAGIDALSRAELTIDAASATGWTQGISATNNGPGMLRVSATGSLLGETGAGIRVRNYNFGGGDVAINVVDASGGFEGVLALHWGTGSVSIAAAGHVVGTLAEGIAVSNSERSGAVSIQVGSVTGATTGIRAPHLGRGSLTISASGTILGSGRDGIEATGSLPTEGIHIDAATVTGGRNGIHASNQGSGTMSVRASGHARGGTGAGVKIRNTAAGIGVRVAAASATGGTHGIDADNSGSGTLIVSATGSLLGAAEAGVRARNLSQSGGSIAVEVADVRGGIDGVSVLQHGRGLVSVTAAGHAIGGSANGILLANTPRSGGVAIRVASATGAQAGIEAPHLGRGALSITATGSVTGSGTDGLHALGGPKSAGVFVAAATVTGARRGIAAASSGTGMLSVSASGTVTGLAGEGIHVRTSGSSSGVALSAASVTGASDGISVDGGGSGTLLVRARGLARGVSGSGLKIRAAALASSVTIAAASASGAAHGIDIDSRSSGTLLVSASGSLVGKTGSGIRASNSSSAGGDLVVSVADASGEVDAVSVTQMGEGLVSVTSTGLVESDSAHGIRIGNAQRSGGISIFAGSVTGAQAGIWASHVGSGTLLVTATGSVEGKALDGMHIRSSATDSGIAVFAAGVSGGRHGIWALGSGTAATSITATDSVAGVAGTGILVHNTPAGSGISIAAASATGGVHGIYAYNRSSGALHLSASGHAVGAAGAGLRVRNTGSGTSVTIAAASVTGAQDGIRAQIAGGAASISASGAVVGNGGDGVFVLMQDRSSELALNVSSATGSRDGIHARANGGTTAGAVRIAASGRVTGSRFGAFAATGVRSTDLILSMATVAGGASGIHASGSGTGSMSVAATGAVTSTSGTGIDAYNSPAGTSLTVSAASVTAAHIGIDALQSGTGALFVSASGHVLSRSAQHYGVRAVAGEKGAGITVETASVSGGLDGIRATSRGSGRVAVSAAGTVVGTARHGISAYGGLSGTGVAVIASSVAGGMHGILAQSRGSGDVSVTATGAVSGGAGSHGIYASNSSAKARGITISAAGVSGRVDGIRAVSSGTGAISIMTSEYVRATGKHGIRAINRAASGVSGLRAGGVSIISASVTGAEHGIYAFGAGAGSISITASGMALGSASDGIHVRNAASGESNARPSSVSISAASATGGSRGIFAANYGTGTLSVTATGAVRGIVADGIRAYNSGSGSSLTVSAAAVAGKGRGISARNLGDGMTAVSASGDVVAVGVDSIGIDAHASGTAGTMTIRAAAVTGRSYGVLARNLGFGALRITLDGTASGAVHGGIAASNSAYSSDMAISASGADGRTFGVMAHNRGAGALSISLTGPAIAISGPGISAVNSEQGTGLSVAATRVSGRNYGILARNLGVGDAAVTATGSVTSLTGEGIHVSGAKAGGGISVSAATVTGRSYGIRVLGMGAGLVSVTASGTVSSSIREAIHAVGGASSTDLFIRAAVVKGWTSGIVASSTGGGDVTAGATGALTAKGGDGIRAFVGSAGGHVTVDAAAITATAFGIHAHGEGAGSVSVSASGTVSARIDAGIHAYGAARGGNVTVAAGAVSGGKEGIRARNLGTGAVSVLASGDVTGSGADAIYASNSASGGALTVSAGGAVTGRSSGIRATNAGAGKMSVRVAGPVSGGGILSGDAGILAHNTASATELELGLSIAVSSVTAGNDGINALNRGGGNLQISADAVSGDRGYGIRAFNYGVGTIGIVAAGPVTSGFGRDGIRAHSDSSGTGLSVRAGSVSGDRHGIFASSDGSGELSVSVSGSVTGGAGLGYAAIKTQTAEAQPVMVEIKSGAAIAARNQTAILDGSGTAAVAIRAGSSVSGAISLGAGPDELLLAGGDTSGIGRLDGGAGTDTLRFASGTIGITGGELAFAGYARTASLEGWERVSVETGASVSGTVVFGSGSDELILGGGDLSEATSLDGGEGADVLRISAGAGRLSADILLNWEKVLIDSAGAVSFFGSQTLRTGTLSNAGRLSLDDGAADDALAVTGDFSGGGTLVVNVNFETGTSDTLSVAGDVIGGATGISVLKVASAGTPSGSAIDIVTVAGEVADSAFELIGESLAVGSFTYSLDFVESERKFSLTSTIASGGGSGGFAAAALHGESAPLEGAGIAIAMLASEDAPPEGAGIASAMRAGDDAPPEGASAAAAMLPIESAPSADADAAAAMSPSAGAPTASAPAAASPSEGPPPADAAAIAMPPVKSAPPAAAAVAAFPGEGVSSVGAGAAAATLPGEDIQPEGAGEAAVARDEEGSGHESGREGAAKSGQADTPKTAMRASAASSEANAPRGGETSGAAVENSGQGGPAGLSASAQGSGGAGGPASGASASNFERADSPESPEREDPMAQGAAARVAAAADDGGAPPGSGAGTSGEDQRRDRIAGTDGDGAAADGDASTDGADAQSGVRGNLSASAGPVEDGAHSAPERADSPGARTAAGATEGAGRRSSGDAPPSIMRATPAVLLNAYGRLRPLAERNPNRGIGRDGRHVGDRFRVQAYGASENLPKDASGSAVKASRYGIRGEMDLLELEGGAGIWTFGVTARRGSVSAESNRAGGAQSLEAAGYDLGAAATWRGASGAYVDLQARYGRIESDIMSEAGEPLAEGVDFGLGAAGLEIGRRAALNADMSLASSAQVSWSAVSGDAFADESGAHVDFGTDTAVKGRLSLAVEFVRGALSGYVSGGVLHDFALDSDATVNGVSGGEDFRGGAAEIAGGADWRLAKGADAYFRASHSAGSDDRSANSVSAGFSWKW